jgi:hypothetical protein
MIKLNADYCFDLPRGIYGYCSTEWDKSTWHKLLLHIDIDMRHHLDDYFYDYMYESCPISAFAQELRYEGIYI